MIEFTPWFDGRLHKPARPGVYQQRNAHDVIGYQHWNGARWGAWCRSAAEAKEQRGSYVHPAYAHDDWRGLMVPYEGDEA